MPKFKVSKHCIPLPVSASINPCFFKTYLCFWRGELCCNFSFSSDLTQMVNFHTWIPEFDSHSLALLDLIISSGTSICSAMAFPSLVNSDHGHCFLWLPVKLKTRCHVLLDSLWLFLCWLGWSLWLFERCSMGGYL